MLLIQRTSSLLVRRSWTLVRSYSATAKCNRAAKPITTHLGALNDLFLHSYGLRKSAIKETLGATRPVMVLHRDHLILKSKGNTSTIRYVPNDYHLIKTIAHIACVIHTLKLLGENQVDTAAMKKQLLKRLKAVLELLQENQAPAIVKKYEPLLTKYRSLLEDEKEAPLADLAEPLKGLLKDAAVLRTDALHAQVKKIREQMCPKEWEKLDVIVMGPRMPREGELAMQYAHKMILQANPSLVKQCPHLNGTLTKTTHGFQDKKLIYVESIQEVDRALDELTTEICDEILGEALLGDKEVMRADFLKDAVAKHLETLKP